MILIGISYLTLPPETGIDSGPKIVSWSLVTSICIAFSEVRYLCLYQKVFSNSCQVGEVMVIISDLSISFTTLIDRDPAENTLWDCDRPSIL